MVAVATRFREALGFPAKAIGVPLEMSCIRLCQLCYCTRRGLVRSLVFVVYAFVKISDRRLCPKRNASRKKRLCHAAIPLVCQAAKAAASGTLGLGRGMEEVVGNSTGRFRGGLGRWITGTMVGSRLLLCRCEV